MTINLRDIIENAEIAIALDWYKDDSGDYTQIGNLVYRLKYNHSNDIVSLAIAFKKFVAAFEELNPNSRIDFIVPVPSYNPRTLNNPNGTEKIMYLVAEHLGRILNKGTCYNLVQKMTDKQAKTNPLLPEDIQAGVLPELYQNATVLVIDDLFGTGNSANYTLRAIKEKNPHVKLIFVTATKNKYGGLGHSVQGRLNSNMPKTADNGHQYFQIDFKYGDSDEHVNVFEDKAFFDAIKGMNPGALINFQVKRNQKGYWNISKINSMN
jgi:hypothetical protein